MHRRQRQPKTFDSLRTLLLLIRVLFGESECQIWVSQLSWKIWKKKSMQMSQKRQTKRQPQRRLLFWLSMKKLKINLKWFKIINAQKYFLNQLFRSFGNTFVQTKGEGRESLLTKFAQNIFQTNSFILVGNHLGVNDLKSFWLDLNLFLEWYVNGK